MKIDEIFANKKVAVDCFPVLIEISKGSKNKYEMDKESGFLRLDRVLYTSTHYPHNYGFIPKTFAEDGDPLDVMIISSEAFLPLSICQCKPIGVLKMIDSGSNDEKIIAVCINDPFYNQFNDISELPKHIGEEIIHFFKVYKSLEPGKYSEVLDVEGVESAKKIVKKCIDLYDNGLH